MAEMAQALGKTDEAATYRQLFTNICSAFQAKFVAGDGTVGSGAQGCYALALNFNLLTPAQRVLAAGKLISAVKAQNGRPSTGMVTTHMLLPTLTSIGRSDLAYQMLAKTDYPSWGYEVSLGATTIWELWNSVNADGSFNTSQNGMNSLNHANFGTCAEWFYRGILGIDLLEPGFKKILISPQIGGNLTWADGHYDSIQGRIVCSWGLTNSTLTLNVSIPPNATGVVNLPTLGTPMTNLVISESGTVIWRNGAATGGVSGVTFDHVAGTGAQSYTVWNVQSGNYQFGSPVQPVPEGLVAEAGNGVVKLGWNAVPGASGYRVKRSSVAGGPYTSLSNVVLTTNYNDFAVTNGATYYYVISALSVAGESQDCPEVKARPMSIVNFGFELPTVGNYQYLPSGASWTFGGTNGGGGAGITANNSGFTGYNSPAPEGVQVAFLQNYGTISQRLVGLVPGTTYTVTFSAAQRADSGNQHGGQSWNVTIDGSVKGNYNPGAAAKAYTDYTATFVATATTHVLAFVGTDLAGGDNTVFIDNVRIDPPIQFVPPTIQSVSIDAGKFSLVGRGQSGQPLVVESASNLIPPVLWAPLITNQPDASGRFSFTNLAGTNTQQFYRILMP